MFTYYVIKDEYTYGELKYDGSKIDYIYMGQKPSKFDDVLSKQPLQILGFTINREHFFEIYQERAIYFY